MGPRVSGLLFRVCARWRGKERALCFCRNGALGRGLFAGKRGKLRRDRVRFREALDRRDGACGEASTRQRARSCRAFFMHYYCFVTCMMNSMLFCVKSHACVTCVPMLRYSLHLSQSLN